MVKTFKAASVAALNVLREVQNSGSKYLIKISG
jgi:hypothetical protein